MKRVSLSLNDSQILRELDQLNKQNPPDFRVEEYSNVNTLMVSSDNIVNSLQLFKSCENKGIALFPDLNELSFDISYQNKLKITYEDFQSFLNFIYCLVGKENKLKLFSLKYNLGYCDAKFNEVIVQFQFLGYIIKSIGNQTALSIECKTNYSTSFVYESHFNEQDNTPKVSLSYLNKYNDNEQQLNEALKIFTNITRLESDFRYCYNLKSTNNYTLLTELQTFVLKSYCSRDYPEYKITPLIRILLSITTLTRMDFYFGNDAADNFINAFNSTKSDIFQQSNLTNLKFFIKNTRGYKNPRNLNLLFIFDLKKLENLFIVSSDLQIENISSALLNLHQLKVLKLLICVDSKSLNQITHSMGKLSQLKQLIISLTSKERNQLCLQALFQQLQNLACLDQLNITVNKSCQYELTDLNYLGQSLKSLKMLTKFTFIILNKQVNDAEFICLAEGIKYLSKLKYLRLEFLQQNEFGDVGVCSLADSITHLEKLQKLQLILLSDNISRKGTLLLQNAIQTLKSKQLSFTSLEISDYETILLQILKRTDETLEPLKRTKTTFTKLNAYSFSKNYKFQYPFGNKKKKKQENTIGQTLDISTGIELIIPQLVEIGSQGIANFLNSLQNLMKLQLEFERIDHIGIFSIASVLEKMQDSLKELSLHIKFYKDKKEVDVIFESLKKMKQLDYLSLLVNRDNQQTIIDNGLLDSLKQLKQLKLVFIEQSIEVFDSISRLESLNCLWLIFNISLSDQTLDCFKSQILFLKKIKHLSLYIVFGFSNGALGFRKNSIPSLFSGFNNLTSFVYQQKVDFNDNSLDNQNKELKPSLRLVNIKMIN